MVAQHRVELYPLLQQAREGLLEVFNEVARAAVRIDVVADCQHEIERRTAVSLQHLRSNREFVAATCAEVAHHGESGFTVAGPKGQNRRRAE